MTTVWVIEKGSPAQYFCGFDYGNGRWGSINDALWMPTKESVQEIWRRDDHLFTIINENCRVCEHVIVDDAAMTDKQEPPLLRAAPLTGRWHYGNGVLVCGSVRVAVADFDTNPSDAFKAELFDWVCQTLNTAAELAAAREDAERFVWLLDEEWPTWMEIYHQHPDRVRAAIDAARKP